MKFIKKDPPKYEIFFNNSISKLGAFTLLCFSLSLGFTVPNAIASTAIPADIDSETEPTSVIMTSQESTLGENAENAYENMVIENISENTNEDNIDDTKIIRLADGSRVEVLVANDASTAKFEELDTKDLASRSGSADTGSKTAATTTTTTTSTTSNTPVVEVRTVENSKSVYNTYGDLEIPNVDSSQKTYMGYKSITNTSSKQYKLQQSAETDEFGFRRYNGLYMIALGTYYTGNECGKTFRITLDTGVTFDAITGDVKDNKDTDSLNQHRNGNIVEFIVDTSAIPDKCKLTGDMSDANDGMFKGKIAKIERLS
jgi:hypothetical protein